MDANPNEFYMAVIFTSKEAHHANANSPEQNARFQEMMALMAAEPEWHDGEIVSTNA
jgi:quinol monooxygenase YgiN